MKYIDLKSNWIVSYKYGIKTNLKLFGGREKLRFLEILKFKKKIQTRIGTRSSHLKEWISLDRHHHRSREAVESPGPCPRSKRKFV